MATGEASRFSQVAAAYEKAPNVTRERMYIEAVEQVLGKSRKVVIDSKSGNGNMLYLPLDKLMDRRDSDGGTVTVRPAVTVEPDPSASDPRTRVER
jgi:membrane protease subunit HflK